MADRMSFLATFLDCVMLTALSNRQLTQFSRSGSKMARLATGASSDGRRRRSEQSRAKIVDALMTLVKEGNVSPTAEEVAARAEIGMRSVFRHFADMEVLRREMVGQLATQYAKWLAPFESDSWPEKLAELVNRRVAAFEDVLPYKIAADVYRHKSPAIAEEYARVLAFMRDRLRSSLPPELADNEERFDAIDSILSYEYWQRLRVDQKLSRDAARRVIDLLLGMILRDANLHS